MFMQTFRLKLFGLKLLLDLQEISKKEYLETSNAYLSILKIANPETFNDCMFTLSKN